MENIEIPLERVLDKLMKKNTELNLRVASLEAYIDILTEGSNSEVDDDGE